MDSLVPYLVGWPAIFGSLACSIIGLLWRRPVWLVAGAIFSLGFAWYLTASPSRIFMLLGFFLPLSHLGGALAVHWGRPQAAWFLLFPHAAIVLVLGLVVLAE